MRNMFVATEVEEIRGRLAHLRADSPRQWGTMNPAQVVAHCSAALEMAVGDTNPPRMFIGRVIGRVIKPKALGDDAPMRKNSPTAPLLIVGDDRDFERERKRLDALIDRFVAGGPAGCSTHPHCFFGPMTPQEWAILMYKHLDHHLRQFGA